MYIQQRFSRGRFSNLLRAAIAESKYNRFVRKYFKHAERGLYIEQEELN